MYYNLFLEKILLPFGDIVTGSSFMKELRILRRKDSMTEANLEQEQIRKLLKLLDHAVNHSEYYRQFQDKKNIDAIEFLKSMPILDKIIIRELGEKLLTTQLAGLSPQSSSGSSGVQTTIYINKKEQAIQRAYQIHWWEWAGYNIGDALLQTGMNQKRGFIKSIKDFMFRTNYFKAFVYNKKEVDDILEWASLKKDVSLAGYASSLYVLSQFAKKSNVNIHFNTIISWGDKLFVHYRKELEEVFKAKVYETYASSEGLMIAAQKDLPYMYIMSQNVVLEILDDNGNDVPDGEMGHVVVTKLDGFSMPLIRYRIGDLAIKLPKDQYPEIKELPYPLLQKVVGRDTDLVKTKLGKMMVVHTFTGIFEYFPLIRQFCVIQKSLEGIIIQYISESSFDPADLSKIEIQIRSNLKEESFFIHFEKVEHIPATKSGKPQIIQSFLEKSNLGENIK